MGRNPSCPVSNGKIPLVPIDLRVYFILFRGFSFLKNFCGDFITNHPLYGGGMQIQYNYFPFNARFKKYTRKQLRSYQRGREAWRRGRRKLNTLIYHSYIQGLDKSTEITAVINTGMRDWMR